MANEIEEYIANAREKKVPNDQIKAVLLRSGWPEADVEKSLNEANSKSSLSNLPPPPVPHVGMWTGFLYIIFFISLYILATSVGTLLHSWVDQVLKTGLPDDYSFYRSFNDYATQIAIASIIVSYPIFTALAVMLKKQLVTKPYVRNLRARKILIYITLIGTFLIMIGHLIQTIYTFLNGSGNSNTFGHFMVTLVVAGTIFGYFISEVKYDSKN